jgi:hypothetical protein
MSKRNPVLDNTEFLIAGFLFRWSGNEFGYRRPRVAASARDLATALLFTTEAPRVGTADFGAEKDFRIDARRLFRTTLNALRMRGNSRSALSDIGRMNQTSGSASPQVGHNLA